MPTSFAVKHNASKRKALVRRLATYSVTPWSFSSKERETESASRSGTIYVIEVRRTSQSGTTYWLGYWFRSTGRLRDPAGGKWDNEFEYKNVSTPPGPVVGQYFPQPVLIQDPEFNAWYLGTQGMVELPSKHAKLLERMFVEPSNGARACA
jgi:hypothetical protein